MFYIIYFLFSRETTFTNHVRERYRVHAIKESCFDVKPYLWKWQQHPWCYSWSNRLLNIMYVILGNIVELRCK